MSNYISTIRGRAPSVLSAMTAEPSLRISLRDADLPTMAAVVHCLVLRGINRPRRIGRYLASHQSPLRPHEVADLLVDFNGYDPERHLWHRLRDGAYDPTLFSDDYDFR